MRKATLVFVIASLASVACGTDPHRVQRRILDAIVPTHAVAGDSIHISFNDDTGPCDTGARVETHERNDSLRLAVYSVPRDDGCIRGGAPGVVIQIPSQYNLPPHSHDFTVVFAEPDGRDFARDIKIP